MLRLVAGSLLVAGVQGFRVRSRSEQRKGAPGIAESLPERTDYDGESLPEWPIIGLQNPEDFAHCHLSESDCRIEDMTEATLVYTDSDNSRCFNGEPFAFLVHPGARDKLLFYLPGGGACWELPMRLPGVAPLCFPGMLIGLAATGYNYGVMDFSKADNVFQDYTVVSPPYCGGGAHVANTTVKGVLGTTYYQHDYNNNEFARSWFMENLDQTLDSFVIMGSSAGALGAALWADFLLSSVKYQKATVLLDSYVGVFPESQNAQGRLLRDFGACNLPIMKTFREACEAGEAAVEDIFDVVVEKYPAVAFAHMQAKTDLVQRAFYSAVAVAFLDLPELIISGSSFYKRTNTMMERFNRHPNYVTYLVDGFWHVFTPWSFWYSTTTAGQSSKAPEATPPLFEWAGKLIRHEQVSSHCNGPMEENGRRDTEYCDENLFPKTLYLPGHPSTPAPTEAPKDCPLYCALRLCILSDCKNLCSFCEA